MVEVGNLEIGGSIQTAEIERGLTRIDKGLKGVSEKGKSVGSDFERIAAQGKRLTVAFGTMAIAGTAALIGWVKDTPAVAGSMAKINLSLLKLKMTAGEALAPVFESAANGLNKLSNWANENENIFQPLLKGIATVGIGSVAIGVGGWIFKQWKGFFGLFKGMSTWTGWTTIGTFIGNLATKFGGFLKKVPGALLKFFTGGGGTAVAAGTASAASVPAVVTALAAGPLVNTYFKDENGQGFLDRQIQEYIESDYYKNKQFQKEIKQWSRNGGELEAQYFL